MAKASLIDTEKVFHGWGDSLQDGAFQQLVTYAQERYGLITCSKMWIFTRFCQGRFCDEVICLIAYSSRHLRTLSTVICNEIR